MNNIEFILPEIFISISIMFLLILGVFKKDSSSLIHNLSIGFLIITGILILKPGEEDTQEPHESDEVYFIISGNGFLKIKNKDYEISKDKLFFVGKNMPHYFHSNTKELKVLYFFGGSDS